MRPNPDALLRFAQQTEAKRGRLRIFLGYAPGVGKTYRMLQVARDLVIDHGADVVIGIVEHHRRADTASMVLGLPLLPRRKIEHRGQLLEEFDLELALRRKPKVLLLDELAHTNAPGSQHAKRWQDVEVLLAAGIDVFTTLNVQHIESLNDVIAQLLQVRVRETVPDALLDAADAIELIDIAPEELVQRLLDGKIYLKAHVARAQENFFQTGHLLALRELALRRTAQRVDDDVQDYRALHGVDVPWPSNDRIVVGVSASPSAPQVIRAAARMALQLRCAWHAVHVEVRHAPPMSDTTSEQLESAMRLAEALGASVHRASADDVATALLQFAANQNATRVLVGKPRRRFRWPWQQFVFDRIVRDANVLEVHVVTHADHRETVAPAASVPGFAPWPYVATVAILAAATALAAALRTTLHLPDPEMLFLLAVMVTAVLFGRGPSLFAAALAVASYDFFFVPPFYTFSVDDRRYFLTFLVMFVVSLAMSELTGRLRRQETYAREREARTAVLYAMTRELAEATNEHHIAAVAARFGGELLLGDAAVLLPSTTGSVAVIATSPALPMLQHKDIAVAQWSHTHGVLCGQGTDTLPGAAVICAPLRVAGASFGVLAVAHRTVTSLSSEQRAMLGLLCQQVAGALERHHLAGEARHAALRAKTEEMRASLLSLVSHDLRTPLASITGAASTLCTDLVPAATRVELAEAIVDEAARLERLVANLLDMTRLDDGTVCLKRDWVPVEELLGSAIHRIEKSLKSRKFNIQISEDVPMIYVDPLLMEMAILNLIENAHKYSPPTAEITIRVSANASDVNVEIMDRGPGVPVDMRERVFEKFYRGTHPGVGGVGLGLPICKAILQAHGGRISIEDRGDATGEDRADVGNRAASGTGENAVKDVGAESATDTGAGNGVKVVISLKREVPPQMERSDER